MTYEMIAGYLRGFGISMVPAVLTMLGVCGVRIVWVYTAFAANRTFDTLLLAYPLSLAVTAALLLGALLFYRPAAELAKENAYTCRKKCGGYVFAKNVRTSGSFCAEKASLVIIARPGIIEVQVRRSCAKTKRENGQT